MRLTHRLLALAALWLTSKAVAAPVPDTEVLADLRRWEGWRDAPYRLRGQWHVGLGHNLSAHREPVRTYSRAELNAFAARDIAAARAACRQGVEGFDDLPRRVQLVALGLAFNVGRTGFMGFRHFRLALSRRAYESARTELGLSQWYRQAPAARANAYLTVLRAQP